MRRKCAHEKGKIERKIDETKKKWHVDEMARTGSVPDEVLEIIHNF